MDSVVVAVDLSLFKLLVHLVVLDLIIQRLYHVLEIVLGLLVHAFIRKQLNSFVKELVGRVIFVPWLIFLRYKQLHRLRNNLLELLNVHVMLVVIQETPIKCIFIGVIVLNMHEGLYLFHLVVVLTWILLANEVHVLLSTLLLLLVRLVECLVDVLDHVAVFDVDV